MEKEKDTTKNAIILDENWECYWMDPTFGYMIRCREHPEVRIRECSCPIPSMQVWKKVIFLDQLAKL